MALKAWWWVLVAAWLGPAPTACSADDAEPADDGASTDVGDDRDVTTVEEAAATTDAAASDTAPTSDTASAADTTPTADTAPTADTTPAADTAPPADTTPTADTAPADDVAVQPGLVIDHTCTDLARIPRAAIAQAKDALHIAYQHTSHGSQLITGMSSLAAFPSFGGLYAWDDAGTAAGALDLDDDGIPGCADLSQGDWVDDNGDTPWVVATRALLDDTANRHITTIVWSWCSINGHDAQRYVDNMEKLIAEYPDVTFVFMTGHAEGQGEDAAEHGIHYNNELIRRHCAEHGRWLFDFADIEAHDPSGAYFWDQAMTDNLDYSGGNWAVQWCAANEGSELAQLTTGEGVDGFDGTHGCAHSDSPQAANLNCVLKGRAAWWLWARLAGWDGRP